MVANDDGVYLDEVTMVNQVFGVLPRSTCRYFRCSKILRQLGDLWIRARFGLTFSCPV